MRPESGWFSYAIEDPALLHATLFHQAVYFAKAAYRQPHDYKEIWEHQGRTIALINERLGEPVASITDTTIAAVACLASHEVTSIYMDDSLAY